MQTNVSVTADPAAEATMKKRNTLTIGDQLKSYARHPGAGVLAFLTLLGAVITFALLFFLIGYGRILEQVLAGGHIGVEYHLADRLSGRQIPLGPHGISFISSAVL